MVAKTSDGPLKPRGRPRQFNEDDVLDRAVDLLWREGPAALSLNELAAELGLAKPALARTFGGKDDLLIAALRRYRDRVEMGLWEALAEAATPKAVARAYLRHFVERLAAKPMGSATGCLLAATTEATAAADGPIAETARALNADARAALVRALTRAGAADPDGLATFLHGQYVALAFLSRAGAEGPVLRAFTDRALRAVADEAA